jgi:release factor glutamine methyltransferase
MDTPILTPMELNSSVYEPAEDSFLLLDALEKELDPFLSSSQKHEHNDIISVLEVGCGSGIISTAIANFIKNKYVDNSNILPVVFAIDINPEAALLTQKNANLNGLVDFRVQPILLGK